MEDPFRVSKVNELARSLLDHGLASDMDEALVQAEKLVRGESPKTINAVENVHQGEPKPFPKAEEEPPKEPNPIPRHELDKINHRLDEYDKKIDLLMSKMNEIIAEINKIESGLTSSSVRSPTPRPEKPAHNEGNTKPAARTGGLQPGDIKIEDYFYSGSKKQ